MALRAAILAIVFSLCFTFKVSSTTEEQPAVDGGSGGGRVGLAPAPAPLPPHIFINFEECPFACKQRCRLHSRQRLCNRVCMTCCKGCKCVPPGTSGNRELCGPYTQWTTRGNRTKCP